MGGLSRGKQSSLGDAQLDGDEHRVKQTWLEGIVCIQIPYQLANDTDKIPLKIL